MNLANRPREERDRIEADKHGCLIRHRCGHLQGRERQVCGLKMLDKHPPEFQQLIREAMDARRSKT